MAKRWYRSKKKIIHSREDSWFNSPEKEKVYKENFIRISGENDLTPYIEPKPKPKKTPKKKKKNNKKKK